jgi:hypothetical protein
MRRSPVPVAFATGMLLATTACAGMQGTQQSLPVAAVTHTGTLAQVYYWRARPGKLAEYNRYVREVAEPIDHEAQRRGAFISVTTLVTSDSTTPWTHMRIFLLRDSVQLAGLSAALAQAGERLEPDSARRRVRAEYAATLRDRVGAAVLQVLR